MHLTLQRVENLILISLQRFEQSSRKATFRKGKVIIKSLVTFATPAKRFCYRKNILLLVLTAIIVVISLPAGANKCSA